MSALFKVKIWFIALLAIFAPMAATLSVTGLLIVLDFITGIFVAVKQKQQITSNRMRDTLGKILAYESTLIICYLMQHFMMGDLLPIVNITSTYLAIVEGTSLLEHIESLTGQPVLSVIIDKINRLK
jgi:Bacteriophage holin family